MPIKISQLPPITTPQYADMIPATSQGVTGKLTLEQIRSATAGFCGTAGGSANAIALSPTPAITAYVPGQQFVFAATATNTGATTIAISGLAPLSVHVNGNPCTGGEIVAGRYYRILVVSGSVCELAAYGGSGIPEDIVDAKGDLIVGTADNTVARKAVGVDNAVLVADSTQSDGLKWTNTLSGLTLTEVRSEMVPMAQRLNVNWISSSAISIDVVNPILQNSVNITRRFGSASLTVDITTSGANGLDTGSEAANTWYYGYVIAREDGTMAGLLSASPTSPTLPSGYVYYLLVTAVRNNASSDFVAYNQIGNRVFWHGTHWVVINGTATSETSVSISSVVPSPAREYLVHVELYIPQSGSATADVVCEVRYHTGVSGIRTTAGHTGASGSSFSAAWNPKTDWMPHLTSQTLYYLLNTSTGSPTVNIGIRGFSLPVVTC